MSGVGNLPIVGTVLDAATNLPLGVGAAASALTGKKKGTFAKAYGAISQLLAKRQAGNAKPEMPSAAELALTERKKVARSAAGRRGRQSTVQTVIGTPLGGN